MQIDGPDTSRAPLIKFFTTLLPIRRDINRVDDGAVLAE